MIDKNLTITIENKSYPVLSLEGRPKALLDRTVAEIYGVETKHINQAIKRNLDKFPPDFYYQLTKNDLQVAFFSYCSITDLPTAAVSNTSSLKCEMYFNDV